jgi:hypothetical protein
MQTQGRSSETASPTVLHELAHAWTQQALTEEAREQFLALRDLETWGDDEYPWVEQGSEQAAEIIAWGLLDHDFKLVTFNDASTEALTAAYLHLTGSLPPISALADRMKVLKWQGYGGFPPYPFTPPLRPRSRQCCSRKW